MITPQNNSSAAAGALSAGSGIGRRTEHGRELPHVRGQGQQPGVPGCDGAGMAERSYPVSKVGGHGWEEIHCVRGQGRQPGGATPNPRLGAATETSSPTPKARGGGRERQPDVQGVVAVRAQEGLGEPSNIEGQEGWREEVSLIQGKEQWLCFAGAAVKRYPMPEVRETQVRW